MLPNGCGSFIQQWFSYGFRILYQSTFWVATFLIDFWAAIRITISAALPQHQR